MVSNIFCIFNPTLGRFFPFWLSHSFEIGFLNHQLDCQTTSIRNMFASELAYHVVRPRPEARVKCKNAWCHVQDVYRYFSEHGMIIYIPGTQMSIVLIGKGLFWEGWNPKTWDKQVPGRYMLFPCNEHEMKKLFLWMWMPHCKSLALSFWRLDFQSLASRTASFLCFLMFSRIDKVKTFQETGRNVTFLQQAVGQHLLYLDASHGYLDLTKGWIDFLWEKWRFLEKVWKRVCIKLGCVL